MYRRLRALSAVCVLPFALAACGESPPPDPRTQPPLVRTDTVQAATAASRSFTGVVAARVQSELGFRVSGKVVERLVDTGQTVVRGQPLMRMDANDLLLQERAQQEAVTAARARAKNTADDEARYRTLVAEGAVSASSYDQFKAAADAASAQLKAAEAQAKVAKNASSYAMLVADADGVVLETLAEPGQVVSAGQPVVRLARAGQREAVVHLPETLRPAVGSPAQARLYGNGPAAIPATLRQLSNAADRVSRTFEARYVLDSTLTQAPLGATITIEIPDEAAPSPSLQVPIGALFDAGQGPGVWAIQGTPTTVVWRPVQVHRLTDDKAQVAGNLNIGDPVVSLGAHRLREGEEVRLISQNGHATAGARP